MSSFKADQRCTQRCDDLPLSASSSDSDEEAIPCFMVNTRREWLLAYEDEIDWLYSTYMHWGREVFGKAFHQLGSVEEFANFVFKYMQPGATKSD